MRTFSALMLSLALAACNASVLDADGDGSPEGVDCDDGNPDVLPGATEICDDVDNDCDGEKDESASDAPLWYADVDGDGFGDVNVTTQACTVPTGYTDLVGDCDDSDDARWPGAVETCNSLDDDCDGQVDEGNDAATIWFRDADGDGHGDPSNTREGCVAPDGYVGLGDDCDDTRGDTFPGATGERCGDPHDYNCDGSTGDVDADGDGVVACEDCDDSRGDVRPGGVEVCDAANTDEDCDGLADDADTGAVTGRVAFFLDADGDAYGTADVTVLACDLSAGLARNADDCDDANASVSPSAAEVCDPYDTDEDCDGSADDLDTDTTGTTPAYADVDGDGHGDPTVIVATCDYTYAASRADDCDDRDGRAFPGGLELPGDGRDGDCDGTELCYDDRDADGFGSTNLRSIGGTDCVGAGLATTNDDCNDSSRVYFPGAPDTPADGTDNDCDGVEVCFQDADSDAYRTSTLVSFTVRAGSTGGCSGSGRATSALAAGDCNDAESRVNPSATESIADGVDSDCDGRERCFQDADGDGRGGFRVTYSTYIDCIGPGVAPDNDDCDDTDPFDGCF